MRNIYILLISFVLIQMSCKENKSNNEQFNDPAYSLKDEQIYSYTDVNNPMQGFSIGDKEALDSAFAAFILNATGNKNIGYTDAEGRELSADQAKGLLTQTRVILKQDPNDPAIMMEEKQEIKLKPEDIAQVLCSENWYLDEKEFKLIKKVSHIAPVIYVYDHEGDVRGKKILYWMKVKE